MKNHRVSMQFSRLPDSSLNLFASSVIVHMTGNPAYPAPVVPLLQLAGWQADFSSASAASDSGGKQATAVKNEARTALLTGLRNQASYVQSVARHDLSQLLSSGYNAMSQNRAQIQLPAPAILAILNEATEKLTLRLTPVANARNYQMQIQTGNGGWQEAGIFPQARRIVVTNLTPGKVYDLRARALGGSTGYSDWSNVASRMSL